MEHYNAEAGCQMAPYNVDIKQMVADNPDPIQNKGLYDTNHGLFRQLLTVKTIEDCQGRQCFLITLKYLKKIFVRKSNCLQKVISHKKPSVHKCLIILG